MRLSITTNSVPGNLDTKLETIAEAGFTGIDLYEPDLTAFSDTVEEAGRRIASAGLEIEVFQPLLEIEGLAGTSGKYASDMLERKLDLMQTLEAKTLLVETSTHPEASSSHNLVISALSALAERVARRNLRAALIALPWARHMRTEMQALEIIETVDNDALGLALNSCFSLADGSQPSRLRQIPGNRLFHVQFSDAPRLDCELTQLKNHFSLLPGQGELPLTSFARIVARLGYAGPWSLARIGNTAQDCSENSARHGYRALVCLLDEAAQVEPSLPSPLPGLPLRVYPSGFEFIEFAVNEESYGVLSEMLLALCFRKERKHVSKQVELWRQGAINIVTNSESAGHAADVFAEQGPTVCDMGLRVKDAEQTVARAAMLGTPKFSQPVNTGELMIPAIKGVGGTVVHFIDELSDLHRMWDVDFNAVAKTQAIPPAGLRRIDHVAQTMHYHEMYSWLTYYTSTFEMTKTTVVDVADPAGVIRSQAIASPEGEVRLILNGADERQTLAGAFLADQFGAGVQHIAFATDDIFETSCHLSCAGLSRLPVPDSYYFDLQAQHALHDDFVETLQDGQILYDRNGDDEYFQIYSTSIFRGFFFEIVERRGSYQGYGARNAPTRLTAQMKHTPGNEFQ